MTEIIDTLLKYLWVVDFTTLCVFMALALKRRQNNSSLITQAFVVIISGTIIKYQALVNSFVSSETSQFVLTLWVVGFLLIDCVIVFIFYKLYQWLKKSIKPALRMSYILIAAVLILIIAYTQYASLFFGSEGPSYKLWVITAYYIGIALLDSFAIYVIFKLHDLNNKMHSLIARMYILAFSVAAIMQMLRFNEKYIWESNSFESAYQLGLASINISASTIALLIACLAIYQFYSQKEREGLLWKI